MLQISDHSSSLWQTVLSGILCIWVQLISVSLGIFTGYREESWSPATSRGRRQNACSLNSFPLILWFITLFCNSSCLWVIMCSICFWSQREIAHISKLHSDYNVVHPALCLFWSYMWAPPAGMGNQLQSVTLYWPQYYTVLTVSVFFHQLIKLSCSVFSHFLNVATFHFLNLLLSLSQPRLKQDQNSGWQLRNKFLGSSPLSSRKSQDWFYDKCSA